MHKRGNLEYLYDMENALNSISDYVKKAEPDVAWKSIAGMRDKIIHFYFGVNIDIVWDVAKKKAPELKKQVRKILTEIEKRK